MKSLWIPGNGGKTLVLSSLTVGLWLMGWAPVASAVNGPTVSTWIPSSDADETVGSVSIRLQPGPYNARDVYKVFVTAVAGKDLQLVVTGSSGVRVDYFDERRDNGLYAVFGAVDAGTIELDFQSSPTGANSWTSAGTKALTVGTQRTMSHDTEVPICTWYDTKAGATGAANPTAAQIESRLEIDFPNLKGLPMKEFVSEGSGRYWQEALDHPQTSVEWIVEDAGTAYYQLAEKSRLQESINRSYSLVFTRKGLHIYRRIPQSISSK